MSFSILNPVLPSLGIRPELLDASWRGIVFNMPNSDDETAGRRVVRTYFPGKDQKATQDLGGDSGPINITGRIVGVDYLMRAQSLHDAFEKSGPGLLVHPWLGQIQVIATEKPKWSYDQANVGLITFTAVFELYIAPQPPAADTLAGVIDAIEGLQGTVQTMLSSALSGLPLAAIGAVEGICVAAFGIWNNVVGTVSSLAAAASAAIAGLNTVGTLAPDATYPAAVAALLAGPSAALVAASEIVTPAAIGPGDLAPSTTTVDPRVTTAAILSACAQFTALGAGTPPAGAATPLGLGTASSGIVALAAAAIAAGDAVNAASDIAYTSQQDAAQWLSQLVSAVQGVAALAVTLAPTQPLGAGQVWNACQSLASAVTADINADIGRLPEVQMVTLLSTTPAWLVAQGLYGDTPDQLLAAYTDLVARNGVANPALMGPGDIEALVA